jgi:hypothetical protein
MAAWLGAWIGKIPATFPAKSGRDGAGIRGFRGLLGGTKFAFSRTGSMGAACAATLECTVTLPESPVLPELSSKKPEAGLLSCAT